MIVATSTAALALLLAANAAAPCSGPAPCAPAEDPALRAAVAPLLGAIDQAPPPAAWRRLPPGAREYLEALAADPAARPHKRARALDGVAALGGDGALHRRIAGNVQEPFMIRHAALRGLGTLLPPADARAALAPFLNGDGDPRIRVAAAENLALAAPAEGCPAVRAQVQREGRGGPEAFRHALAACDAGRSASGSALTPQAPSPASR